MMGSITVDIQPQILSWVLTQIENEDIDEKIKNNIAQWIAGTKTPTFNQIEELSKKSKIPLGYFFLKTPPKEEIHLVDYRTVDSIELMNPSRDLIDVIHEMETIQDWMRNYRQDNGFDKCSIVGSAKTLGDPLAIAKTIRKDLGINIDWYQYTHNTTDSFTFFRNLLNDVGIVVMMSGVVRNNTHRTLNPEEFRAFAIVDEWAPLIFINAADSSGARLFSLLHEAVHIWIGKHDLFNDRQIKVSAVSDTEILCNAVAAEILVPEEKFLKEWSESAAVGLFDKVSQLAKTFHCGNIVIARRALDNKKISGRDYNAIAEWTIRMYLEKKQGKSDSGGNFYNTLGSRLDKVVVKAICESISSGKMTYTEAFRLTNTNKNTFPSIALKLGGITAW